MEQNFSELSASSVLVGARTHIELTWPNGPMVDVGRVHHNHESIYCLNHSGGDNITTLKERRVVAVILF